MLFKGIRVLDLSNLLPGPMCSLFLADLGADVIKVENIKGDPMRGFEVKNNQSPYFSALNRNKRSISLNLKTAEGKEIFMKLAKLSDVIIESFRPGKMDSLGIGYDDVKKINSKIIYCSLSGYGQNGKFKDRAGHDLNYSSLSGLLDVMHSKPLVPGVQVADIGCALMAAFSIASSLFNRERGGEGNYIDMSIFHSALSLINIHIAQRSVSKKSETILSGTKPCYNIYETKDGRHLSIGAIENKFWESFCNASNRKDLLARQFDIAAISEMKKLFKSKNMGEWLDLNEKYDFCCEPIKTIEEIISDPYYKNRYLLQLDGITQVTMPILLSSLSKAEYKKAPKLGEHTKDILSFIGYKSNTIKKLKSRKVIL